MGILDIFKKKQTSTTAQAQNMPVKIDPTTITEEKRRDDLQRLMQFQRKIKRDNSLSASKQIETDMESKEKGEHSEEVRIGEALKIQNPFRGN
ncbi:hypothetical protein KC622_00955 [Candidatus Dojkabacteria bacterium]|uniref:Uncharacterized protein n=1 Tax=Candidatus Dojkabacteria bacterium TaxID=2099670 RepID=A0A955HYP4_9BACT|nr:hypothetical protein [Candidatus Dojkabacteria bacterium]MCB9790990.1 hypothetical protein [Candidatus Nomurabacteria bacterium]